MGFFPPPFFFALSRVCSISSIPPPPFPFTSSASSVPPPVSLPSPYLLSCDNARVQTNRFFLLLCFAEYSALPSPSVFVSERIFASSFRFPFSPRISLFSSPLFFLPPCSSVGKYASSPHLKGKRCRPLSSFPPPVKI